VTADPPPADGRGAGSAGSGGSAGSAPVPQADGSFGRFVAAAHASGRLVVQPRMGMSDPRVMREGLAATRRADAVTVGTITLDSYTRLADHESAARALRRGVPLNGYPIMAHDAATTAAVLAGVAGPGFPVQVRHGSPLPRHIFAALVRNGLLATEGGPVSYCLPYGRSPLRQSVTEWTRCCEAFAELQDGGAEPHLETFGGCMMGQLCPPSLLIALSVLEALFFCQHGLRSVSLSYAQQTNVGQDEEAVQVLHRLAGELLPAADWHVVLYAYMGVYPRSAQGAGLLLAEAAALAVRTRAARLIVKTAAEAHRVPTIEENVTALEAAARAAARESRRAAARDTGIYAEARTLVEAVLDLHPDVGQALALAFQAGCLDVPYCLHPDNAGRTRAYLDGESRLRWARIGGLPLAGVVETAGGGRMTSKQLLGSLSHMQRTYDERALEPPSRTRPEDAGPPAVRTADRGDR
jgi:methylaspartate mutase epsilon subunit